MQDAESGSLCESDDDQNQNSSDFSIFTNVDLSIIYPVNAKLKCPLLRKVKMSGMARQSHIP